MNQTHLSLQIYNTVKTIYSIIKRSEFKLVFIFNYHRIGKIDPNNPFHILHTVSENVFKKQINFLSLFGKFVSLDDIRNYDSLSKINFAISFDDVSKSILNIKPYLQAKLIPYAIAPNTSITENGFGVRDKVYFIIKNINDKEILDFVRKKMEKKYNIKENNFSFYRFTKSDQVDPSLIEKEIITPLFESIPNGEKLLKSDDAYLSWNDIEEHYLGDNFVTIVNHGDLHVNMSKLSREQVFNELNNSIHKFENHLNIRPEYFAVPFGHITQNLLIDLNDSLRKNKYKGVLWVNGGGNILRNKYESQMFHLSRIHTPTTFVKFLKNLLFSLKNIHDSILEHISKNEINDHTNYEIVADSSPSPALSFENLVRQGKDYASNISMYKYCYTDNPFKKRRPDYYGVVSSGRINSIGYNFHAKFSLSGKPFDGVYWAGWRKLPYSDDMANSFAFLKAIQREQIVGSYKPSIMVQRIFNNQNWKKILVNWYRINLRKKENNLEDISKNYHIEEYDRAPKIITQLFESIKGNYFFSIFRSLKFYQWRYDQYPLTKLKYFVLFKDNNPVSYFVVLYKKDLAFISDFFSLNTDYFAIQFCNLIDFCKLLGINFIEIETSLNKISDWIEHSYKFQRNTFFNYYHFNRKLHQVGDQWAEIESKWETSSFHETQASGDVLLR